MPIICIKYGGKYTIKCIVMDSNIDKVHNSDSIESASSINLSSRNFRNMAISFNKYCR